MYSERALAPSMLTMPKRSGPTACTRVAICPLGLCKIAALRAACELPRAERDDAIDVDILPPQKEQGYTSHVPQEGSWIREIFLTKPSYQVPGVRGPVVSFFPQGVPQPRDPLVECPGSLSPVILSP